MMDANGNPQYPWEVNWGGQAGPPPTSGAGAVAPAHVNPFSSAAASGGFNEGETDIGAPPGVDQKKYREERATDIAKNRQTILQRAQGARDFVDQLDDYTDSIQSTPEWGFGHIAGTEHFRALVDSPLSTLGFKGPEEAARGAELVNSKASAVVASLFKSRYGGGPGEQGQRGNRNEFQNIEKSIGTSGSFNKATALQAAYAHGDEVSHAFNDAAAAGLINNDFFKTLSPKKIQVGIRSGAIDPHKFDVLQPMTPEAAQALPAGTVFKTTDGRILTR